MVSVAFDELNCGFCSRICVLSGVGAGLRGREVTAHGNSGHPLGALAPTYLLATAFRGCLPSW